MRDSKLLKVADRERLEPLVRSWSVASAVGHASAAEIDALGIIGALRLAGNRAWFSVLAAGVRPDVVLLDGSHNWLSPVAQASLFDPDPDDAGPDAAGGSRLRRAGPHPGQGGHAVPQCGRGIGPSQSRTRPPDDGPCTPSTRPSAGNENKGYGTAAHKTRSAPRVPRRTTG